ncbi:FAD-dependent oxidoreductase [Rhodococcus wratislaviensis]
MQYDTDAIIVGGGFAGMTTARELSQRGIRATVVEA